jgi:hypothetical protein
MAAKIKYVEPAFLFNLVRELSNAPYPLSNSSPKIVVTRIFKEMMMVVMLIMKNEGPKGEIEKEDDLLGGIREGEAGSTKWRRERE